MAKINQERLKEVLSYDPQTGIFRWIKKPAPRANRIRVGNVAGCNDNRHGYILIGIDQMLYGAHRTKEQARVAYHDAALRLHGEFARVE